MKKQGPQGDQSIQEEEYIFPYHYLDLMPRFAYRNITENSYRKLVIELIAPHQGQSVLDAGCGDGRLCYELAKRNLAVTGVDYSERAIKFARVFVPDAEFAVMDLTKEHPTKKFDYVLLVEVLEHFKPNTIRDVLSNLSGCLKDNGKLIITVPSIRSRLVAKHYQHFTIGSLRETIETHFQIEALYGHLRTGLKYRLYRGLSAFDRLFLGGLRSNIPLIAPYYHLLGKTLATIEKAPPEKAARFIAVCKKE